MSEDSNVVSKTIVGSIVVGHALFALRYPDYIAIGVIGIILVLLIYWYKTKKARLAVAKEKAKGRQVKVTF